MPTPDALLVHTSPAGTILAHSAGFLQINWYSTPRTLAATQQLLEQLAQQLHQRQWGRVLINQTVMVPFTPAEQQWITAQWLPRAVREGGYRYGAVVVSPTVLVRLATAYVTTNVQGLPLVYRSFDAEAEAVRWLLKQPVAPAPA